MKRFLVVIDGETGAAYGMRLIEQLLARGQVTVFFTASGAAMLARELGCLIPETGIEEAVRSFLDLPAYAPLEALPSYSSSQSVVPSTSWDVVVIAPASMSLVGALACGVAHTPAELIAERVLSHRGHLVVVPSATPLNAIHLRNLAVLAESGVIVVPAIPEFHERPKSIDDLISSVTRKVLNAVGADSD